MGTRKPGPRGDPPRLLVLGSRLSPGWRGLGLAGSKPAPKRNGGRHRCRPPLSLVPSVLPEGETAFPREVPAEALRPRSVPQVPRSRNIAIPVRVPAGSAPRLAAGFGSLAGSFLLPPCGFGSKVPYRTPMKRTSSCPFAVPSARGLRVPPDPRRKVGSALACAAASRFFLPVARTLLRSTSVRRPEPLSARPPLGPSLSFPEEAASLRQEDIGTDLRVAPNGESGSEPVDNGDIGDNMG